MQFLTTSNFVYNKETRTFSQEISSLKPFNFKIDHSLLLEGKTTKIIEFKLIEEKRDSENDIQYWTYDLKNQKDKDVYKDMKVIIFND